MQMVRICVCQAYADVGHMDMLNLYIVLSFSAEIRKKLVPDLCEPHRRTAARQHKMWRCSQLTMTLDVVSLPCPEIGRSAPEKGGVVIP